MSYCYYVLQNKDTGMYFFEETCSPLKWVKSIFLSSKFATIDDAKRVAKRMVFHSPEYRYVIEKVVSVETEDVELVTSETIYNEEKAAIETKYMNELEDLKKKCLISST